jgi:sec-independent protein translocase protein TatA
MPIGPTELIIILVIVVLLFGARKLPELARGLGQSAKEFRKGLNEAEQEKKAEEANPEQKQS